ncbi:MAG TPA: alpha/beta fold hydrolase [Thermomicrobiales bacterium]|nr:alpha/beta fold hydrolase [Thermomicrobiales bacterium]
MQREIVEVQGLRTGFLRAGAGPALVMLHGIGGNAGQFRRQLDALADLRTVTAWDAPGYVASDDAPDGWTMEDFADHLAGFLDALGIERADVLGQSWGGVLAQVFYGRHPGRVRSLILSDTSAGGGSQPEEERQAALQARLTALETMTPAEMAHRRAPAVLGPDPSEAMLREAEEMMAQIRPSGYRTAAIALANADTTTVLPAIAVPVLVITGEHDQIIAPGTGTRLRDFIPRARLAAIAGAGHLSSQEQPEDWNAAVREFLCG